MEAAATRPAASTFFVLLAGLEAGLLGALWMLASLGVNSALDGRSFWTAENLMASAFERSSAIHSGLNGSTFSGLALYLILYGLLGALFAVFVGKRMSRVRTVLAAVIFALCWYYISFQWLYKTALPLVHLLHVERATILGHAIYGAVLGRFPVYLSRLEAPPVPEAPDPQVAAVGTAPEEPVAPEHATVEARQDEQSE
jgi:hypothetical protein